MESRALVGREKCQAVVARARMGGVGVWGREKRRCNVSDGTCVTECCLVVSRVGVMEGASSDAGINMVGERCFENIESRYGLTFLQEKHNPLKCNAPHQYKHAQSKARSKAGG